MKRPVTCVRGLGALVVLSSPWLLTMSHAAPVAADPEAKSKLESPAEKIRKALDQNVTLDFAEQTLTHTIAQLRDQAKVNIVLDRVSLNQWGISPDEGNVTVKLHNVKLRSGLRTLLGQFNLSFVIIGDALVVTTEEMAIHRQVQQRVSFDLTGVPLKTALRQLSRETATNLVLDARAEKEGQTPITLNLEDVPLETAVRLLAEMADLKPARVGNVLFVTTEARANKLRSESETPAVQGGGVGPLRIEDVVPARVAPGLPMVPAPPQPPKAPPQ